MTSNTLILPRPGSIPPTKTPTPIKAPSETTFTSTFGQLLPKATYIKTPIGRIAYYSLPPKESCPENQSNSDSISRVMFIHGVQTPAIGLYPLAHELSTRFPSTHCVLVDLWGHGLSDTPILPHSASLFHSLITTVLDTLAWDSTHVLGYSFGGSTAASFTAQWPERVKSMVLVAPAGLVRFEGFSSTEQRYLVGGEDEEEEAGKWVIEWLEGGELVVPNDWEERVANEEVVAEAVRDWEMKVHEGHMASVVGIVRDGGVWGKHAEFMAAAKTGVPGFCVLGQLDDLCSVQDLEDVGMRNVAVVSEVGHGVVRQRVSEVASLVEEFWNSL
ncbi:hypothetical protein N7488_006023 [Penicillium malachiteum]|nr:hypothetical protein N7488_006023 [Penicillium malachiteum]